MHERFIAWLKRHAGVEFVTCDQVNTEFWGGEIEGVRSEQDADI